LGKEKAEFEPGGFSLPFFGVRIYSAIGAHFSIFLSTPGGSFLQIPAIFVKNHPQIVLKSHF
jgi:hypothetical protein